MTHKLILSNSPFKSYSRICYGAYAYDQALVIHKSIYLLQLKRPEATLKHFIHMIAMAHQNIHRPSAQHAHLSNISSRVFQSVCKQIHNLFTAFQLWHSNCSYFCERWRLARSQSHKTNICAYISCARTRI